MSEQKWFFLLCIVMFFIATALAPRYTGWSLLATRFRARQVDLDGQRFMFASGLVNRNRSKGPPLNYNRCLFFTITDSGFLLSLYFPFNIFSPPLFIPWREVEMVTRSFNYIDDAVIRICGFSGKIVVSGQVSQPITTAYEKYLEGRSQ
jgi:hypothetical protein